MRYSISTVLVLAAASAGIASGAKCDKDNAVDYKTYYTAKNPIGAEVSLETFAKTYSLDVWKLVDELDGKTGIKKTDSVECMNCTPPTDQPHPLEGGKLRLL